MEQPLHDLRPYPTGARATPARAVSIILVVLIHLAAIWALATGLAQNLYRKTVEEFKAEVIPPKQEQVKPPPPPPPELQKPPPPFVPPPDISIQSEAPSTNTITVQSKVAAPPPPKPVITGITAPVSYNTRHNCNDRFYPPIAVRLNQEGTTRLRITVSAAGEVTDAKVVDSSGHDSLDEASVKCVMAGSWGKYKPAMQNGQPIDAQTDVSIQWKLQ